MQWPKKLIGVDQLIEQFNSFINTHFRLPANLLKVSFPKRNLAHWSYQKLKFPVFPGQISFKQRISVQQIHIF